MAIDYFSKATRYESLSLPAFFERANCYLIRKNFGAAVSDYNRAIIIDSTFAPAYNNRAFARIRHYGDKETSIYLLKLARKDLEKVIALNQGIPATARFEYFFNLGLLDLYQSEYMSAKLSFDTAIAANPGIAKIYYYRGAANFLARYYQRAALDFKKASELGFLSAETPEFLKVIDLINAHEALTGEHVGR